MYADKGEAWWEGYNAFQDHEFNAADVENPYDHDDPESVIWQRGWDQANSDN